MRIECVLLDVDGTLVDSNDAHASAWADVLTERGQPGMYFKARPMIGMGGDKMLPLLTGLDPESSEGKRVLDRRVEIFTQRYLPKIRPFPCTTMLLRSLHELGLRLVVATSAGEEELGGLLKIAGAEPFLYQATSSDDAENSKPDPDILKAALRKGRCEPARAIMIGDTPYDVEAARRAGVATIGLKCGGWSEQQLRGARAIFRDPADLLARRSQRMRLLGR